MLEHNSFSDFSLISDEETLERHTSTRNTSALLMDDDTFETENENDDLSLTFVSSTRSDKNSFNTDTADPHDPSKTTTIGLYDPDCNNAVLKYVDAILSNAAFTAAALPQTSADHQIPTPRLTPGESISQNLHVYVLPYRWLTPRHVEWLFTAVDLNFLFIGLDTVWSFGTICAIVLTTKTRCLLLRVDPEDGQPMDADLRASARQRENGVSFDDKDGRASDRRAASRQTTENEYRSCQTAYLRNQSRGRGSDFDPMEPVNHTLDVLLSNEDISKVGWDIWFDAVALYHTFNHKTGSAYDVSTLTPASKKKDLFEALRMLYPDAPDTPQRVSVSSEQSWSATVLADNQVENAAMEAWAAYMCAMNAPAVRQREMQKEIDRISAMKITREKERDKRFRRRPRSAPNPEPEYVAHPIPAINNQTAISCLHEKRPPLSLPRIPKWQLDMCARSAVLARSIDDYTERHFDGDVVSDTVQVLQDGRVEVINDRYTTRIRTDDQVLIQLDNGDVLKGFASRHAGKKTTIKISSESWKLILARKLFPKPSAKRSARPTVHRVSLTIKSISVDAGNTKTMADMARDGFAKDLLTGMKPALTPMIEAFFGDKQTSQKAIRAMKKSAEREDLTLKRNIAEELAFCLESGMINVAQHEACDGIMVKSDPVVLVQGPPGSGKTSCIVANVVAWDCARPETNRDGDHNQEAIICIAQSNVAVKNIAEKLKSKTHTLFRIFVSSEFHDDWHESQYSSLRDQLIVTNEISNRTSEMENTVKKLRPVHVFLCTLHTIVNERISMKCLREKKITHLIVDEASQIPLGEYLDPMGRMPCLKKAAFFGDDSQLPPYGDSVIKGGVPSVFSTRHRDTAHFLNTQYRMPTVIADFISKRVYDRYLRSDPLRPLLPSTEGPELLWVDVNSGLGEVLHGTSFVNATESSVLVRCVRSLLTSPPHLSRDDFVILTGYDAQRKLITDALAREDLPDDHHVYNIDTYQGHECDTVLVSLTRTHGPGFLNDLRRNNVMLTRAKKRMIVFGCLSFATGTKGRRTLVGELAMFCKERGLVVDEEVVGREGWLVDFRTKNVRN